MEERSEDICADLSRDKKNRIERVRQIQQRIQSGKLCRIVKDREEREWVCGEFAASAFKRTFQLMLDVGFFGLFKSTTHSTPILFDVIRRNPIRIVYVHAATPMSQGVAASAPHHAAGLVPAAKGRLVYWPCGKAI